jgi:hypothetical protein
MPKLDRILETSLYVDDLGRAAPFVAQLLNAQGPREVVQTGNQSHPGDLA